MLSELKGPHCAQQEKKKEPIGSEHSSAKEADALLILGEKNSSATESA
jgi:hypothetical protein